MYIRHQVPLRGHLSFGKPELPFALLLFPVNIQLHFETMLRQGLHLICFHLNEPANKPLS
jgi:hypothetical protein